MAAVVTFGELAAGLMFAVRSVRILQATMADRLLPSQRSALMARVRSKDTAPELIVRKIVHALGYRFRLHGKDLPGRPDLVLPRHHAVIFVHGCFWHRHSDCRRASLPKSRTKFWHSKLARNSERDSIAHRQLRAAGWRVLVVWECQTKKLDRLRGRLSKFLST